MKAIFSKSSTFLSTLNLVAQRKVRVDSSSLAWLQYHRGTQKLSVCFKKSGKTYSYEDVEPATVKAMMIAPSKGRFFSKMIRPYYEFELVEA